MAGLPAELTIGIWVACACWAVAAIAYFLNVEITFIAPMVILGVVTGAVEWLLGR